MPKTENAKVEKLAEINNKFFENTFKETATGVSFKHVINNDLIIVETTLVRQLKKSKAYVLLVSSKKAVFLQTWQKVQITTKDGKKKYAVKLKRGYFKVYDFKEDFENTKFKRELTFDDFLAMAKKQDDKAEELQEVGKIYFSAYGKKSAKKSYKKQEEEPKQEAEEEETIAEEEEPEQEEEEVLIEEEEAEEAPKPKQEENKAKEEAPKVALSAEEIAQRMNLKASIVNFCKDWGFEIDNRELDHLLYENNRAEYLYSIAKLAGFDDSLLEVCQHKCDENEPEWQEINSQLDALKPVNKEINQRLVIYYGSAGTGKTFKAMKENPDAIVEVAKSNMKADQLFTSYKPENNRFEMTNLAKAMTEGKVYILDEGNLLPPDCWATLQAVLDNKSFIVDKDIKLEIKEGFKIITTMNLHTNLATRPLPSPIISRAKEIINFDRQVNNADTTAYIW